MFYKNLPVSVFEPRSSGIGSDRSANWATTTAPPKKTLYQGGATSKRQCRWCRHSHAVLQWAVQLPQHGNRRGIRDDDLQEGRWRRGHLGREGNCPWRSHGRHVSRESGRLDQRLVTSTEDTVVKHHIDLLEAHLKIYIKIFQWLFVQKRLFGYFIKSLAYFAVKILLVHQK